MKDPLSVLNAKPPDGKTKAPFFNWLDGVNPLMA